MKTRKGWVKSGLYLEDYISEPCVIDEELHNYLGEIVAPQYCCKGLIQTGEASLVDSVGVAHYMTSVHLNGKYFYLGILPEFK